MSKAILHIDGDSFFASCEVSLNPRLKGMPVVTGQERGIASAMSKEAKALGITRGMPVYQIQKHFPQVIILHSDYTTYEIFARRMFAIVRRYTDLVEEYSIDECFALLHQGFAGQASLEETVRKIKSDLQRELDMTFSLGVAPTKVLAKLASSRNKPDGLTILREEDVEKFLSEIPTGKIWGVGPAASRGLGRFGIYTALDLYNRRGEWVEENFDKHLVEIWHELHGRSLYPIRVGEEEANKSVQATRTFKPPTSVKTFLLSELSKNIENATVKVRSQGLVARRIYYFLKTQEFRYHRLEVPLDTVHSTPPHIIRAVHSTFDSIYRPDTPYRATGVTLADLVPETRVQDDLLGLSGPKKRWQGLYKTLDTIDKRYGSHSIVLATSLQAFRKRGATGFEKRLRIPYLGEVN